LTGVAGSGACRGGTASMTESAPGHVNSDETLATGGPDGVIPGEAPDLVTTSSSQAKAVATAAASAAPGSESQDGANTGDGGKTKTSTKKKAAGEGRVSRKKKEELGRAIQRMDAEAAEELGQVYDAMSHTYLMVRGAAAGDLGKAAIAGSEEALSRLLHQLADTAADFMRESAAGIVGGIAIDRDDVCEQILSLLSSAEAKVRESALSALSIRLQSPRVLAALRDAQEGRLKEFARETHVLLAVAALVDDPNGRCRFRAVDALSRLVLGFHAESVVAVARRLADPEEWIRRHSAEVLSAALADGKRLLAAASPFAVTLLEAANTELLRATVQARAPPRRPAAPLARPPKPEPAPVPARASGVARVGGGTGGIGGHAPCRAQAYEHGLTLEGGGDVYLRRLAIKGLAAAAADRRQPKRGAAGAALPGGGAAAPAGGGGFDNIVEEESAAVCASCGRPERALARLPSSAVALQQTRSWRGERAAPQPRPLKAPPAGACAGARPGRRGGSAAARALGPRGGHPAAGVGGLPGARGDGHRGGGRGGDLARGHVHHRWTRAPGAGERRHARGAGVPAAARRRLRDAAGGGAARGDASGGGGARARGGGARGGGGRGRGGSGGPRLPGTTALCKAQRAEPLYKKTPRDARQTPRESHHGLQPVARARAPPPAPARADRFADTAHHASHFTQPLNHFT